MIMAWGGILNLILFLISILGLGYYAFLTVLSPNTIVTRYDLGEKSVPIIRIVGTFVLPLLIIGVYLIFRGPEGDPDSKQDVGDEIVGHVFVIIAIILIYRLSDIIYV